MLAAGAAIPHHGANLLAGVLRIEVIEQIAEGRELVITPAAVYSIIDGDESHVMAGKDQFRVVAHLQVITPEAAHVLHDPGADLAFFHQAKTFLHTGTVEIRAGVSVVHQNLGKH